MQHIWGCHWRKSSFLWIEVTAHYQLTRSIITNFHPRMVKEELSQLLHWSVEENTSWWTGEMMWCGQDLSSVCSGSSKAASGPVWSALPWRAAAFSSVSHSSTYSKTSSGQRTTTTSRSGSSKLLLHIPWDSLQWGLDSTSQVSTFTFWQKKMQAFRASMIPQSLRDEGLRSLFGLHYQRTILSRLLSVWMQRPQHIWTPLHYTVTSYLPKTPWNECV